MRNDALVIDGNIEKTKLKQFIFMGHNKETISLLPNGHGLQFPAFLTHKNGVDKTIIDLMRPLVDNGVRISAFATAIKELHCKEYFKKMIKREHGIME